MIKFLVARHERLEALEKVGQPALKLPQTYVEALRALADTAEEAQQLIGETRALLVDTEIELNTTKDQLHLIEEVVMGGNPHAAAGHAEQFMQARLEEELKRFNNPASDKTRKLFLDYAGVDVTKQWKWSNYEPASAKKKLDELLGIRGDIVHRSKAPDDGGPTKAHPVKREDLAKAIRFLKRFGRCHGEGVCVK